MFGDSGSCPGHCLEEPRAYFRRQEWWWQAAEVVLRPCWAAGRMEGLTVPNHDSQHPRTTTARWHLHHRKLPVTRGQGQQAWGETSRPQRRQGLHHSQLPPSPSSQCGLWSAGIPQSWALPSASGVQHFSGVKYSQGLGTEASPQLIRLSPGDDSREPGAQRAGKQHANTNLTQLI